MVSGGFNGWPHIFVFEGTLPEDPGPGSGTGDGPGPDSEPEPEPGVDPVDGGEVIDDGLTLIGVASCSAGGGAGWLAAVLAGLLLRRRLR